MFEKENKQKSVIKKFNTQITISAHDAGAAYHLLEIYKKNISNSKLCLDGPAFDIFNNYCENLKNYDLTDSLLGSKYLISGTGWSDSLEHNSRKLAAKKGIFNIAVIDHWVNYFDRFKREEELILPDEIWVTDDEALKIANNVFSNIPINKIPNFWLEDIKLKVIYKKKKLSLIKDNHCPTKLLYFTEPMRSKWGNSEEGEFQSMRYFFENIEKLSQLNFICPIDKLKKITIKLHPSEITSKYDDLIEEFNKNIPINVTMEKDISKVLVDSEACIGCETQALVVSLSCGLPTFSSIPPWGPKCRLPHKDIIHLRNIF